MATGERPRRGPAPIASFDHDVSDESSPETKQTFRLPEIREDPAPGPACEGLAPPEPRGRSHSSPALRGAVALHAPATPRIDISRASSSSHHDSRDSSPELALFAGAGDDSRARLDLGFREDGALELRSSTEELAFLEGAPGERAAPAPVRRHSRKDSQGSETALLVVSGRTSRLSSVGSQCSANSALSAFSHASRVSRLSVVSGVSRSPSPHKMLLETSFCGPKPIETDPEICAAAVEERLLEIAKLATNPLPTLVSAPTEVPPVTLSAPGTSPVAIAVSNATAPMATVSSGESNSVSASVSGIGAERVDARDRRDVRIEVTVESARPNNVARLMSPAAQPMPIVAVSAPPCTIVLDNEKQQKESRNRARAEERRVKSRERREPSEPEVYKSSNRSKNIIRIKLKPDHEYDDDDDEDVSERTLIGVEPARKPVTLALNDANSSPAVVRRVQRSRTPSPTGVPVSRKSSFCSLFKSRETIASPESPCDVLRRKKSLNEGRSRSKSRDRSITPTSAAKIRGSVLSLFKTTRKNATSPSPSSRDASPVVQPQRQFIPQSAEKPGRNGKLKYYEQAKDGIIHIPLRTPPEEAAGTSSAQSTERDLPSTTVAKILAREPARPVSAPQRLPSERPTSACSTALVHKPTKRTVLPDGSIIIPLHSPTEKSADCASVSSVVPTPESSRSISAGERTTSSCERNADDRLDSNVNEIGSISERTSITSPTEQRGTEEDYKKRRERITFTTQVGSGDQVFCTQLSITKTPSVTGETSESLPSFVDTEEVLTGLRDTHISAMETPEERPLAPEPVLADTVSPGEDNDSSESEGGLSAETRRAGSEVERRGLVVQESFEEELPYVPTTLPLERSLALPMVPVRERSGVRVAGVRRPRAGAPTPPAPPCVPRPHGAVGPSSPAATPAPHSPSDKLHIRLPRRIRTASASAPPRPERPRTRSGSDETALASCESRKKPEWIDFEEVPERRKQPKRIQTLPAAGDEAPGECDAGDAGKGEAGGVQYVEPEHCRCECHARRDDELPLLPDDDTPGARSPSLEYAATEARVELSVHLSQPSRTPRHSQHPRQSRDRSGVETSPH